MSEKLPYGWPEGVPLPSIEEAQAMIDRVSQQIKEANEEERAKLPCRCVRIGLRHGPWCPDWVEETRFKIDVLDKGSVELREKMGRDLTTVEAARISFDIETENMTSKETRLLKYLATHEHTAPYRHATLMLRFKAPLFVARQMWKHIVGIRPELDLDGQWTGGFEGGFVDTAWNEISGRYVQLTDEFYVPDVWRRQSTSNKQGSAGPLDDEFNKVAIATYDRTLRDMYAGYRYLVEELGVAREQARIILPSSIFTSWVWTASLQALLHVVDLRAKPDAQEETRQYGIAVRNILMQTFPVCTQTWEEAKARVKDK